MLSFEFCPNCGSLKERGKICKSCSKILKTSERSERIGRNLKDRNELNKKKLILKNDLKKELESFSNELDDIIERN